MHNWIINITGKLNYPTPYYNSIICQDLVTLRNDELRAEVFRNHPNFNDALILLKIWLHQRELDEVNNCLSHDHVPFEKVNKPIF